MENTILNSKVKKSFSTDFIGEGEKKMEINKSLITNLVSALLVVIGHFSPYFPKQIFNIGIFALSGAFTNWMAFYMLFEKVPFLYGSGVVPNRFEDFKLGIKNLMIGQFFTEEKIKRFFHDLDLSKDFTDLVDTINYDLFFKKLKDSIMESPFSGMLGLLGGEKALEGLKAPFRKKMKEGVHEYFNSSEFEEFLNSKENSSELSSEVLGKIEELIEHRLQELTPKKVKEIVKEMIHKHLGWLVVWGGVFGGLLGLLASFYS